MQTRQASAAREISMADTTKCAHQPCTCTVDKDHKYCSEFCEDADKDGIDSIGCDCPHDCAGKL